MADACTHIALGFCRYADFKPGDLVELTVWGWEAGLGVNYAYTFGKVVKFENGILTVLREGMKEPQNFHPCYWIKSTENEIEQLRKEQYAEFWLDHCPDAADDLALNE